MNKNYTLSIFLLCFLILQIGFAQEKKDKSDPEVIENTIESILENAEEDEFDYTSLYDDLSELYQRPVNLNHASKEDLERLYMLNELLINNLYSHIEKTGKLLTILELQSIKGFDLETIQRILPFVKVSRDFEQPRLAPKEILKNGKHEVFIRYQRTLEEQKGYTPPDTNSDGSLTKRYLGTKDKIYTRYKFNYSNNIKWGFVTEKDAGEEFYKGSNSVNNWYEPYKGFDFYSGHIYLRNIGPVKNFVLGDYHVQLGQGLTMWTGFARNSRKTEDVIAIKKSAQIIRPNTSVDENLFLRGSAATVKIKDWELTAFYSKKKIDANISLIDTLSDEIQEFTSFQTVGFHRTEAEILDEKTVEEMMYGGHLAYKKRIMDIGVTFLNTKYGADLRRNLKTYNQFEFSASDNMNFGLDYNLVFQNMNFFGEFAGSKNGGIAYLGGLIISLDPRLTLSALYRNYERGYQALANNAFRESSKSANERGWYLGAEVKPMKKWTLTAYYDIFTFPWLRYRVDAPSEGNEVLAQLTFKPSKKLMMYVRYKREKKEQNTSEDVLGIDYLADRKRSLARYHIDWKLSDILKLRNRVDLTRYELGNNPSQNGYWLMQDVIFDPEKYPFSIRLRYALFETESFNAAVYAYEHDVLYSSYTHSFSGKGNRYYIVLRYKVIRGIDIWIKFSQTNFINAGSITTFEGPDVIGSDLNQIQGSTITDIKAQVRFKF